MSWEVLTAAFASDFPRAWRSWSAKRAKPTAIRDLKTGVKAKVTGFVEAKIDNVRTPLTKRDAIFWHTRVAIKRLSQEETVEWRVELDAHSDVPFWLIDQNRDRILIEPTHALTILPLEDVNQHPRVNDENDEFGAFMRAHGLVTTQFMGIAGEHRFEEALLRPAHSVAVWGMVSEASEVVATGYRDAMQAVKRITSTPKNPMVILRA